MSKSAVDIGNPAYHQSPVLKSGTTHLMTEVFYKGENGEDHSIAIPVDYEWQEVYGLGWIDVEATIREDFSSFYNGVPVNLRDDVHNDITKWEGEDRVINTLTLKLSNGMIVL